MPKRLTEAEIARFRADGLLFPLRALPETEIAERRAALEALEAARAGRIPPTLNAKIHLLLPWAWSLVHASAIVDPVEDLLGPDILCWGTSFIIKNPRADRYVTWHQDATHWRLTGVRAVTAWLAFTPSTPENGGVRMLPGTNHAVLEHRDNGDARNMLGRREEVVAEVDEAKAVDVTLAPGEMSLHDPLIVHGSNANMSDERRIGFAIRYIAGDIGQRAGLRNSATLVRGRDHGLFDLETEPEADFHPAALRRHARALRQGIDVIFKGDAVSSADGGNVSDPG